MGYDSRDLNILDEMIQEKAKVSLTGDYDKKQVILKETHGANYSVKILKVPENTIVINADIFDSPKSIFTSIKGQCKRADFVIISDEDDQKFIIIIEMKAGKAIEKEVIQQLKGAECFIAYCREIGRLFWQEKNFLREYNYRFVSLKNINIPKRSTRDKRYQSLHDCPENMLKIYSPKTLQFKKLTNGK